MAFALLHAIGEPLPGLATRHTFHFEDRHVMTSSCIEPNDASAEPAFELIGAQPPDPSAGTRTDEWFAIGDRSHLSEPPSVEPPHSIAAPRGSSRRRQLVRLVGCLAIGGTVGCLIRLGAQASFRHAILDWGLFGQSDRLYSSHHVGSISR